eukprot:GHVL01018363.1.p1 GENE.GHVL01018363.1~~GHVL01018363.1.p1  ORF type:complete len:521 (+),score=82.67 GHVL01018363.1:63-1625(+)
MEEEERDLENPPQRNVEPADLNNEPSISSSNRINFIFGVLSFILIIFGVADSLTPVGDVGVIDDDGATIYLLKGGFKNLFNKTEEFDDMSYDGSAKLRFRTKESVLRNVVSNQLSFTFYPEAGPSVLGEINCSGIGLSNISDNGVSNIIDFHCIAFEGRRTSGVTTPCPLVGSLKSVNNSLYVGNLISDECDFGIKVELNYIHLQWLKKRIVRYSVFELLCFLGLFRSQIEQYTHSDSQAMLKRLSVLGLSMQSAIDVLDGFLHLAVALRSKFMFNTFALIAVLKFAFFSIFELRFLVEIWKLRREEQLNEQLTHERSRQEISNLYGRFYAGLLLMFVILWNFIGVLPYLAIILYFYWLPQIFLDVYQGSRSSLHWGYLAGTSISRVLVPVYLWACPSTIFNGDLFLKIPRNNTAVWIIVIAQVLQVLLSTSQKFLGTRWFVPWWLIPGAYNYYRCIQQHNIAALGENPECVICMSEIQLQDRNKVLAPCDHLFHGACLEEWMDVKMECPTCRRQLPPMG